jgi:hypothetical protein
MTKKLKCDCDHEYQDKRYGKKIRLHNFAPKGYKTGPGWRCTVCKSVKPQ